MLSIIQLVAPSWAALPGRESAHWSCAMGERKSSSSREGEGEMERTMAREERADQVENASKESGEEGMQKFLLSTSKSQYQANN